MSPRIRRTALTIVALAVVCSAPSAKELNLRSYGTTPQMQVNKCPPSMVGTWPDCTCPPNMYLDRGTCFRIVASKFCIWHENNGTPLGIGGSCPIGPESEIGSPCTCTRTVEHKVVVHHGTVAVAPLPGQPSTVR